MAAKRKNVDREKLELDYRAGLKSFREMAADYGISAPRIKQIANEEGWERDLTKRIQIKAEAKLNASILNSNLNAEKKKASEREIVDANVDQVVAIRLGHRQDIRRNRNLARELLGELESQTGGLALYEQLGELLNAPDDKGVGKLNEIYRKVISFPSRIDSAKKLAETLKTLIGLEREAFNLKSDSSGDGDEDVNLKVVLVGG